jgi:phage replication-related protein YjqB (UPF0714/DUF867 family)
LAYQRFLLAAANLNHNRKGLVLHPRSPDHFDSYAELAAQARLGEDYAILVREGGSGLVIMAPHGGGIEPGTVDLADAIAHEVHGFYAFKGIRKSGNRVLHLTCNRFDEPIALRMAAAADIVVTVHGCREKQHVVFVGGLHLELKGAVMRTLLAAGFTARSSEKPGLRGVNPDNLCNRGRHGRGVQLEVSRGLREAMFANLERRSLRARQAGFYRFVQAVRSALPSS